MRTRVSMLMSLGVAGLLLAPLGPSQAQVENMPAPLPEATDESMPTPTADEAVDLSVTELQQMMNLPTGSTIKEYQEDPTKQKSLFDSQETIDRIFSKTKPPFIYFPEGVDPMIIPWVRDRIMAQERFEEATVATANKDFDKAIEILKVIREKFPNTEEGQKAPSEMEKVQLLKKAAAVPPDERGNTTPVIDAASLPEWVRKNTSAIMLGNSPVVLVGNDFLRSGDSVPRYPSVRVKEIGESEVVYVYQNKEFVVEVVGSF
jgi:hypothetical protein